VYHFFFVPITLGYQAWSCWVFGKRLSAQDILDPEDCVLDEVPA
jgi:cytochrome bd-type quinol oxidase subunit 2